MEVSDWPHELERRRRRIFMVLLGVGSLASAVGVLLSFWHPEAGFVVGITGLIAFAVQSALLLLVVRRSVSVDAVAWIILVGTFGVAAATLGYGLYLAPADPGAAEGVLTILQWVPVVYVFGLVAFDGPRGQAVAASLYLGVVMLVAPYLLLTDTAGPLPVTVTYLVQVLFAHLVILVALAYSAEVRDRLADSHMTADRMRQLALTDVLTGLANRRWAEEQLALELERAERYDHPFAVALLDIDHFKRLNDRFGHAAGDEELRGLAKTLRAMLRRTDHVARWGGEEFVVLMPETPATAASGLAEAMCRRVATRTHTGEGITVSIGVAGYHRGDTTDSLLERADQALYRAKAEGRNRVASAWPVASADPAEPETEPTPSG